jgi:glycosyltransferase involved in cell wall biosynthesis
VPGWAYHNNTLGLERHAPPDFAVSSAPLRNGDGNLDWDMALGDHPADLLFLFDFSSAGLVRAELARRGWESALMVAWSMGWQQLKPLLHQSYGLADAVLVSNRECWELSGRLPAGYLIPYGVDEVIFNVRTPIALRRPKVLWVGSQFARAIKGYDDYVVPLQTELRARGLECECLLTDSFGGEKRNPAQMAAWYNSGTVIVCASEAEGTPNPALEGAACGCTVVSTRVGNMPELIRHGINGYLVDRNPDALLGGVLDAVTNYERLATQMRLDIVPWHWSHRAPEFYAAFREVLGRRENQPALKAHPR